MHDDDCVDDKTEKPEIILDYNRTKGGVDVVGNFVQITMFSETQHAGLWSYFTH